MPDELKDIHFPKSGLDLSAAFSAQPNRPAWGGEYARTTALGVNVRGWEALTQRVRGGSRTGLRKYIPVTPTGTTFIIQCLDVIVTTS